MPRPNLRETLAETRRAAAMPVLDDDTAQPTKTPAPTERSTNAQADNTQAPAKSTPKRVRAPRAVAEGLARRSYYLADDVWNDAKAAFLADWRDGGEAESMAAWVGAAMRAFAGLTPAQRADAIPLDDSATVPSATHALSLPADAVDAMEDARTSDITTGDYVSLSAWVAAALTHATSITRERVGGTLPPAPARLPKRLVR